MKSSGIENLPAKIQQMSLGGRPPLYQLLSVPFILLFGRSIDSGLWINLVFQVVMLISVYNIGKIISSSRAGLLAALLVSVYPPLIQISRVFRPNFVLVACLAFSIWSLLILLKNRQVKLVWGFICSLGFGIFIHPTMFTTLMLPVIIVSVYLIFFQSHPQRPISYTLKDVFQWLWIKMSDSLVLRGFLPALFLVGGVVLAWYSSSGLKLLNTLRTVNSEELAAFREYDVFTYGFEDVSTGFGWFLQTMPYALSNVFTGLFVLGFMSAIFKRRWQGWFLVVLFIGAYIYFGLSSTKTWMQFAVVLPIVAVITSVWPSEIKANWLSVSLISLTLITSVFVFSYVNGYLGTTGNGVAKVLSAPLDENNSCLSSDLVFCPAPPIDEDWRISELLSHVINDSDCKPDNCTLIVFRVNPNFSDRVFRYYLNLDFPNSHMNIPLETNNAFSIKPFDFSALVFNNYIVFKDTPEILTVENYNDATINFLNHPPDSFEASHADLALIELPRGVMVRLIKRIHPLTLDEAQDIISAINLDEKYKSEQYRVLAPLYAEAGQLENALEAYEKAISYEKMPDAGLYFGLAGVYDALGEISNAARLYRQVVSLVPGTKLAKQSRAWLNAHPQK